MTLRFLLLLALAVSQTPGQYRTVDSSHKMRFTLKPDDAALEGYSCPGKSCTCESHVSYIQILPGIGTAARVKAVNEKLKSETAGTKCEYLLAMVGLTQQVSYISNQLLSVIQQGYELETGAGGSCHSNYSVTTFDLNANKQYLLRDIINPSSIKDIRAGLPASILAERDRREGEDPSDIRADYLKSALKAVANLTDDDLLKLDIFIEKHQAFVNIGGYYFSCAAGSFHPAPIPQKFITSPLIQRELRP